MSLPQDIPGEVEENNNDNNNETTQVDRESERVQQICSPRDPASIKGRPLPPTPEESFARGLPNEDLWMLLRRFNKVCQPNAAESIVEPGNTVMTRQRLLANILCQSYTGFPVDRSQPS